MKLPRKTLVIIATIGGALLGAGCVLFVGMDIDVLGPSGEARDLRFALVFATLVFGAISGALANAVIE